MSVFVPTITRVGPLELRPWTMITYDAISALELSGKSPENQAIALAWLQSRPPAEVRKALTNGTAAEQISAFYDEFPPELAPALLEWCNARTQAIDKERVDVVPRSGPDPGAPGN